MQIRSSRQVGQMIRAARQQKKITQTELASLVGATNEWISRLEQGGLQNPGFGTLMRVFEALDLDLHLNEPTDPDLTTTPDDAFDEDLPSFLKPR